MPIFGSKDKDGNRSVNLMMVDGIPSFSKGVVDKPAVNVTMLDDRIVIKARIGRYAPVELRYTQIVNAAAVTEKEIIEKEKSVIGRGIVGGLLFGRLGAQVGAMSGIKGTKKKVESHRYVVINYTPSDGGDVKVISFEIVGATMGIDKFMADVRAACGIESVDSKAPISL